MTKRKNEIQAETEVFEVPTKAKRAYGLDVWEVYTWDKDGWNFYDGGMKHDKAVAVAKQMAADGCPVAIHHVVIPAPKNV